MKRLIITFVFLTVFVLGTQAQDYDVCAGWGLTGDNCTLMQQASEQLGQLQSAQFDLDVTINYDSSFMDAPLHMAFVGSYWLDPEVMAELADSEAPIFDTPVAALQRALAGINTELTMRVDMPSWITQGIPEIPSRLGIGMALVDSVGYVDLTDLSTLAPDEIPAGWYGVDLRPFIPTLFAGEANPFRQTPTPAYNTMSGLDVEGLTTSRLPDVTIDGETVAVIEITMDTSAMFDTESGDVMKRALREAYIEQGFREQEAKEMVELVFSLIENMRMDYIFMIGQESHNFYTVQMYLDANLTSEFWDMFGDSSGVGDFIEGISMIVTLELRDHNRTEPVEAPAGAEVIPFTEIMPMLFGQQSS